MPKLDTTIPALSANVAPPRIEARETRRIYHGIELTDPFGWLAAENWRETLSDPRALPKPIRAALLAENDYCDKVLAPLKGLRKTLLKEMRGRVKEDDSDPPWPDGPYAYYERYRDGGEHPLYCRRPREGGAEELLFDGDAMAKGHEFFDLDSFDHAPDHAQLAWSVDDKGSELHSIRTRSLRDAKDRDDVVTHTDGGVVWAADSKSFYYVRVDDNHRTAQVFRHVVGTAQSDDALILEETDPAWFVSLGASRCERYGVISIHGHDSSECWLIDLRDAAAPPVIVAPREERLRYDVEPHGENVFILANDAGADDFAIRVAPLSAMSRENWREVVAHRPGCMIVDMTVFADFLVRLERENSLPRIVIREIASGAEHVIAFDEEAYSLGIETGFEFDASTLRFTYSSLTTPEQTFEYDMRTHARALLKQEEIPSGHNPADYVTRRIFAPTEDGETVPVTLLHRADFTPVLAHNGGAGAPLLLYGYGAYGDSLPAAFDSNALSLVDRGFVYALAHVRGGTDKGWRWYEKGKLEHKTNSFTDFLAAARGLIAQGYTREGAIVAEGASAGGMLMGAVVNMAPELFAGVIAGVPFVDVLNTMLRADLPLTPPEWLEWGNPIEDESAYRRLANYSPYDNIRACAYPPILALAGLTDPRVTYWEPAKWVARLRATMTGGGPILLHTQMSAGHGGASGRFERLEEVAMQYAFALACAARLDVS